MSEAKFTKGERVVTTCGSNVSVWCDSNSITSAESFNYPDDAHRNEILANANLIAAAPEMYDLLETLSSFLSEDGLCTTGLSKQLIKAKELLAKARSE